MGKIAMARPVVDLLDLACVIKQCGKLDNEKIVHYEGCDYNDPEHCYACQDDYAGDGPYGDCEDDYEIDFADPGGRSALRAENVLYTYEEGDEPTIHCPTHPCHATVDFSDSFCRKCGTELLIRNNPCGDCGCENMLTAEDVRLRYRCDHCADASEGYGYARSCSGGY
jgi:hypothetical protein